MAKRLLGKEVNEALVAALQTRTAALQAKGHCRVWQGGARGSYPAHLRVPRGYENPPSPPLWQRRGVYRMYLLMLL